INGRDNVLRTNNPSKRMADPLEIAKLAVYLASDDSAYVVGADFLIDGGVTAISPGAPEPREPEGAVGCAPAGHRLPDPQRLRRSAPCPSRAICGYVGSVDRAHEFVGIDWLGEVTLKTSGQRATALVGTRMRGERNGADGYSVRATLQLSQSHHEVVTVEHRHADIGQYDLHVLLFKNVQRFRGRGGQPHLRARRVQHRADERPRLGIVVDEHHA